LSKVFGIFSVRGETHVEIAQSKIKTFVSFKNPLGKNIGHP
jgi:hypothetical protein